MRSKLFKNAIKESFDNLTTGVCYFGKNGIPILCNRTMHRVIYLLSGQRRLQVMEDIEALMRIRTTWVLLDGSVWRFSKQEIEMDGETCLEYMASDVTELYERKTELEKIGREHKKLIFSMKKAIKNTIAITREEEMLALKMRVHGKVGWCLQHIRQFYGNGCPQSEKDEIIAELYEVIRTLQGEAGAGDEEDSYTELVSIAEKLGVSVIKTGEIPTDKGAQSLFMQALRECITNTVRHAQGNEVYASVAREDGRYNFVFTNNGIQPDSPIAEGGGLSSLRRRTEDIGGAMTVSSEQRFSLTITLPRERR